MEIETLLDVQRAGGRLYARCLFNGREGMKTKRACNWRVELDVETMIWTRGRALPVTALWGRLRCPHCGCRQVAVSVSLPPNEGRLAATAS